MTNRLDTELALTTDILDAEPEMLSKEEIQSIIDNYILHEIGDIIIAQRKSDGYINATAMCKAAGKKTSHYFCNDSTINFLNSLSELLGVSIPDLVIKVTKGPNDLRGTWVAPEIAGNLGQWCNSSFAAAVSVWLKKWFTQGVPDLEKPVKIPDPPLIKPVELRSDLRGYEQLELEHPTKPTAETSQKESSQLMTLEGYSSIYNTLLQGYRQERRLLQGMPEEEKKVLVEIRMNIADLTRRQLTTLREHVAPGTTDLQLNLLSASTSVSLPCYNTKTPSFNNQNDMVSVNQRQQELFLLGEIPRYLMAEEISVVGKKASRTYQMKFKEYPSRIKYTYADGKEGRVNAYRRLDLSSIVDPHIKTIFGILSVIKGDASVI